jgi:uncharacterized membrane protein YbhN (UPF0104 family)
VSTTACLLPSPPFRNVVATSTDGAQAIVASSSMKARSLAVTLLPLAAAAVLLILLIRAANIDLHRLAEVLIKVHIATIALIVLMMAVMCWCSAKKWQIIAEKTAGANRQDRRSHYYFAYTAFGMLAGQVIPAHVSTAISRGVGLMLHRQGTVAHGAGATAFEQSFDLLLAGFCAVATLATIALHFTVVTWFLATVCAVAIGAKVAALSALKLLRISHVASFQTNPVWNPVQAIAYAIAFVDQLGVLQPPVIHRLSALSLVRYLALIGSAYAVALAGDLPVPLWQVAAAMPLVVIAVLISFVPGGLGINEWTLASVLTAFGLPFSTAVEFALLNRVLNIFGAIMVAAIGGVALVAGSRRHPD